jgi:predicted ATPase/DNA-binding winged helix-turn-helix (wHTH) protein
MELIRVGNFDVHPADRRISVGGRPLDLGARAFDLLLVLAETPGRLVTKATLLERVWPRLVVDENNLAAQVASLRRVLGAGAIRTVPRFGYRLDLPVTPAGDGPGAMTEGCPTGAAARGLAPQLEPLVGRSEELAALCRALARDRLVTLVGSAGIGKTRLAREVLVREQDAAAAGLVPLEAIESVEHVAPAIAFALGLSLPEGVDRFAALGRALRGRVALVILDGAEHLAGPLAEPVGALVARTPSLRVLVTSQAPLGRLGESVHRLGPLPVEDATQLFRRRASQADHRFEVTESKAALVADICGRLDCNPLAVELAAARVPSLGLEGLRANLDDRFRLLKLVGHATDPRHGVLQAAFDWSYGLLAQPEQDVFDRLGAFGGSFTLEAAARCVAHERIDQPAAVDLLGRLVDRSLVAVLPGEPARYALLETARCYARERLRARDAVEDAERRMALAQLHVLDRAYEDYWSVDEAVWLHHHEREVENLLTALGWAQRHDAALAVALYGSAWPLFVETDLHTEARAAHAEAVSLLGESVPASRVARFWEAVATYDSERQADRARYAAEIAARMHIAAGDAKSGYYAALQGVLNGRHDLDAAGRALAAARRLEQPGWPARLRAHGAIVEGALLASAGEVAGARAAYRRALDHAVATSERQALAATVSIVELDIASGALTGALQLARPLAISLRHSGRRETRHELLTLLFGALLLAGEIDEARAVGVELYELARGLDLSRLYFALDAMALLAAMTGRHELAAGVARTAESAHESHGQFRPRPAGVRIRAEVQRRLDAARGAGWRPAPATAAAMGEEEACEIALGLRS